MENANVMLFGTVGTPISTPKKPGGSIGAILKLQEMKLGALELGWVQSVRVTEEKCAEIKRTAADCSIQLSVHAPYYINLNANEEEWPKSRQRLMDAAHYGNLAGATDIIFHPGSYFEQPPEDVLIIALPRLADCAAELQKNGNPVRLRPETMGKSAMLGSFEDTLIMSKEINAVLPCLDFAHLHARPGDGSVNSSHEWKTMLEAYEKALGAASLKKLHIHLSGIEYSQKGEKNHLPIQESDLNITQLLETLKKSGCAGRILCESPILEEDAKFMQNLWHSL
jgi:deoxyribonuclease IV